MIKKKGKKCVTNIEIFKLKETFYETTVKNMKNKIAMKITTYSHVCICVRVGNTVGMGGGRGFQVSLWKRKSNIYRVMCIKIINKKDSSVDVDRWRLAAIRPNRPPTVDCVEEEEEQAAGT